MCEEKASNLSNLSGISISLYDWFKEFRIELSSVVSSPMLLLSLETSED